MARTYKKHRVNVSSAKYTYCGIAFWPDPENDQYLVTDDDLVTCKSCLRIITQRKGETDATDN